MDRIIKVTGKGNLSVKPDMIRLLIYARKVYKVYSEAFHGATQSSLVLHDILSAFGFEKSDLKTLSISVDTKNESYKDKNGEWKSRLVGYEYKHSMKLEFDMDNERLGKVLYALANCPLKPEINIVHTVKDVEASKNKLLGNAVSDAKDKAKVLSEAAGVTLGDIQTIDYSWGEVLFESYPMAKCVSEYKMSMPDESYEIDIDPDDIDVSDTVTVIWEIK